MSYLQNREKCKYTVTIPVLHHYTLEVEANSVEEAINKVYDEGGERIKDSFAASLPPEEDYGYHTVTDVAGTVTYYSTKTVNRTSW